MNSGQGHLFHGIMISSICYFILRYLSPSNVAMEKQVYDYFEEGMTIPSKLEVGRVEPPFLCLPFLRNDLGSGRKAHGKLEW